MLPRKGLSAPYCVLITKTKGYLEKITPSSVSTEGRWGSGGIGGLFFYVITHFSGSVFIRNFGKDACYGVLSYRCWLFFSLCHRSDWSTLLLFIWNSFIPRTRLRRFGDRAFSVAAPTLLNSLPPNICNAPTHSSPKTSLAQLFPICHKTVSPSFSLVYFFCFLFLLLFSSLFPLICSFLSHPQIPCPGSCKASGVSWMVLELLFVLLLNKAIISYINSLWREPLLFIVFSGFTTFVPVGLTSPLSGIFSCKPSS